MCGIAGIYAYRESAPPVDEQELLRIREAMIHRGPDGAGLWISPDRKVGLAHRRLAIIDLSEAGAQPMATADGNFRITFNGEIYNYRELRKELEAKGHRFRSNSDTEVLLHLYADRGQDMVHALRGMYAFGIWDAHKHELFLARDPFGIKPLYYSDDGRTVRFASQVKALLKGNAVNTTPEPAGSVGFLIWGHVPEPYTLYREIRSMPAGAHICLARAGRLAITQFFDIGDEFRKAEQTPYASVATANEILRETITNSVRAHLVSDVPVGLFLSAGIDSTTLAGIASTQVRATLNAITLGFPEFKGTADDEVPIAAMTAERFRIRHQAHWVAREDFEIEFEQILESMDQPSTDGVNTYFVSRAAARAGMKVALSGLGGDEIFGGYPSFLQVPRSVKWLGLAHTAPFLGRFLRWVLAPLTSALTSPKYAGLLEYGGTYGGAYLLRRAHFMPWEVKSVLDPATVEIGLAKLNTLKNLDTTIRGLRTPRSRISALELSWYMRNQLLRDADWAGMAHSLEIRVPLVDVQVLRALAPLMVSDSPPTKRDFAGTALSPLPDDVLARAKSGFVTPVVKWISEPLEGKRRGRGLRNWARRILPPQPRMFRALVLVTDAFGGRGGIAKFNRDLLAVLASMPECAEVVVTPRLISSAVETIPPRISFRTGAANSKLRFVRSVILEVFRGRFDLVIAGHINLAPLGILASLLLKAPSMLFIHGIESWSRHKSLLVRSSLSFFQFIVGVSNLTLTRFAGWADVDAARLRLLPNSVDVNSYGPGLAPVGLAERLGLRDRTVIMTLGRLASDERYKGFDEIIEVLPALAQRIPNISYLICGDGPDRARLEAKADALQVRDRVVFAGFVSEEHKADYYRLSDAYVMPSWGEGFGIAFLEALACGIPALGSTLDGSREALLDGALGCLVDPSDSEDVKHGVLETLKRDKGKVPDGLSHYSYEAFTERAEAIVRDALANH